MPYKWETVVKSIFFKKKHKITIKNIEIFFKKKAK